MRVNTVIAITIACCVCSAAVLAAPADQPVERSDANSRLAHEQLLQKAKARRIVRGTLRGADGSTQKAWSDLDAKPVKTKHRYSDAEIEQMMGRDERPRDRQGRFKRAGLLTKLRTRKS